MSGTKLKLLITDDEQWIYEKLSTMLEWSRLSIKLLHPAHDGEDALKKISLEKPDILITDINMPFMNGNELIRKAKSLYPGLQIIVLSGYDDFGFVREALVCGAIDYLLKPVNRNTLLDVVNKAVGIIHDNNEEKQEKVRTHKKLLEASSVLRDGELSMLIKGESRTASDFLPSQLELEFSIYSLVLFHLIDLTRLSRKREIPMSELSLEVKTILEREIPQARTTLFNNIYARNEFILLTDLDRKGIELIGGKLPEILRKRCGSRARMAVSRSYFTFDRLTEAYAEARFALLGRKPGETDLAVRAEEAENLEIQRRITPEHEKQLLFALQSGNKGLARDIIFHRIGLKKCGEQGWLLIEIRQTVEYLAGMIFHHADTRPGAILGVEIFDYLLHAAQDLEDLPEVCSIIDQLLEEVFSDTTHDSGGESMKQTIRSVEKYINENYFQNISLASLSEMFSVDRSYLCKTFKQVTGDNLMQAIAKKRIGKAQEYIRQSSVPRTGGSSLSELSLAEISDLVGYEEYAYFSRVFRKIAGLSPSEYRARFAQERTS